MPTVEDDVPPAVVEGSVELSPSVVRAGATLVASFELDEDTLESPQVRVGTRPFTLDARDGRRWTFSYRATGAEPEEVAPVLVTAIDQVGNVARDLALGTVTFDFTPPALSDISIEGPSVVAKGGALVVQVAVAEELPAPPVVTLGARTLELISSTAGQHRFEYVARGDEPEGAADIGVALSDRAGNTTQRTVEQLVTFDFTAPEPVAGSFRLLSNPVRTGAPASLAFVATEPLAAPPEVFLRDGEREVVWHNVHLLGVDVTASQVVEDLASGSYEIVARGLRDAAGNDSGALVLGTLDVDTQPPVIGALTTSHRHARAGDRLVVTFDVDEALSSDPVVSLGEQRATLVGSEAASFEFAFDVEEETFPEGAGTVVVVATDRAGNVASALATVELDYTAPSLSSGGARPVLAASGAELIVSVTASEPLAAPPTLTVEGPAALTFTALEDSAYSWRREVTPADADGTYLATVTLTDLAGNTSTVSLPAFDIDVSPPVISGLDVNRAAFSRAEEARSLTVTFDASEPLEDDGGLLVVTIGGRPMTCDPYRAESPNHACHHTVDADDREGANIVLVAARDGAGNSTTASTSVVFDFTAPQVSSASVAYAADLASPLSSVTQATAGTRVIVTAVAQEAIAATPAPTLTLSQGAELLVENLPASRVDPGSATFEFIVPAQAPDGAWVPQITWQDLQGNRSTVATFASPVVQTLTSTPTLVVDQEAVTFLRSRWGNAAEESFGPWTLPPGSVYALAPSDPLSSDTFLPAGAFGFAEARPLRRVRVWADALKETLLGVAEPGGDGTWPRTRLARVDTPSLWVTGIDVAGNESQVVGIEHTEWVATTNPTATAASPHHLELIKDVDGAMVPSGVVRADLAAGHGLDGVAVVARTEPMWRSLQPPPLTPPDRVGFLSGYDTVRGRLVRVGGADQHHDLRFDEVWEWDGAEWTVVRPERHPPARERAVMAFDAARGRLVLFGGYSYDQQANKTTVRNDLWEWDGVDWEERTPDGTLPAPRYYGQMAYDSLRERVILYGGDRGNSGGSSTVLGDTWAWDGTAWTQVATAAQGPGAMTVPSMAYDSVRDRLVLLIGADTWELNGDTWSKVTTVGHPKAPNGASMAFDPVSERIVLFGGSDFMGPSNETWTFDGTTWAKWTPAGDLPAPRSMASFVFDTRQRRLLLQGGETNYGSGYLLSSELWSWDGARWEDLGASTEPGPEWLPGAAAAYDEGRNRLVVFGGETREAGAAGTNALWEWSPAGWKRIPVSAPWPDARHGAGMAYDPVRKRIVLFGGMRDYNDYFSDTWEWDGEVWTQHDTSASMAPRYGPSMTFHAGLGQVVMVGGTPRDRPFGDPSLQPGPWAWDGTSWANLTPASSAFSSAPWARTAYDPQRDRLVLFADVPGNTKTWEWDGSTWIGRNTTVKPAYRIEGSMFFDPDRGKTVLYGGQVLNSKGFSDVWEWDGATWVEVEQRGAQMAQVGATLTVGPGGRRLLVGGVTYNGPTRSVLWEWVNPTTAVPAFQLTTSALDAGFDRSQVVGLRVRAHCGGRYSPFGASDLGATLWGWPIGSQAWVPLASNETGVSAASPWIAAPPNAALEWTAASPGQARQFVLTRDRLMAFQCRPSGASGLGTASTALDYLEVRVLYRTP